jgi:hypothetical protein
MPISSPASPFVIRLLANDRAPVAEAEALDLAEHFRSLG